KDGQIKQVKVGFKGDELQTLEIEDGFGQRSVLRFVGFKALPSLPGATFEFAIPSGAEVIRQ
ncbi:MAG: outer membrane lipoprotein carrier protein LolA, partial [Comamonas sp.]|nr:outer membrane lipoprotein carrier protein LolA [Comamonas sp.]